MLSSKKQIVVSSFSIAVITLALFICGCAGTYTMVSPRTAPPPLPAYEQPFCPGPGYIWVPGYWAWGSNGYYWVPGIWTYAPRVGYLWTPGYWEWHDGVYMWHHGYWGRHVGFYGGVCYGYGYSGVGYEGGYWRENVFYYNTEVTRVNVTVVNTTYKKAVSINGAGQASAISHNGGPGGLTAKPTSQELVAAKEPHIAVTSPQKKHVNSAGSNHELLASVNHGQPHPTLVSKMLVQKKQKDKHRKEKQPRKQNQTSPDKPKNHWDGDQKKVQ